MSTVNKRILSGLLAAACLVSVFPSGVAGAKRSGEFVLYDSRGQVLGVAIKFDSGSATVRQGRHYLSYQLRNRGHGSVPVFFSDAACSQRPFTYAMPNESPESIDDRWLGFASGRWFSVDKAAIPDTLKARKDAGGKVYFYSSLAGPTGGCVSQGVASGSGVIFDEMLAVSLVPIEVNPDPTTLVYPLFVEKFDDDEEYELGGDISIERLGSKTWISVTTNVPFVKFQLVARTKGKRQVRWNSSTDAEGFKKIVTPRNLTGFNLRLMVDGEELAEFLVN